MGSTPQKISRPVIEKRGKKHFVRWGGKESGPWDWVSKKTGDTNDRRSWMKIAKKDGKLYLLIDGVAHGPFDRFGRKRWFTISHNAFVCTVIRGREIFLIEGGRMERKGEIVRKGGGTLLEIGGRCFGPYKKMTELMFGAGGRHWTTDIEKGNRWNGFVVDGIEYGPFPRQFFGVQFSPDGNRWFVALDRGRAGNVVCRFIMDGKTYGRLKLYEIHFFGDNRFLYVYIRRGKHIFVLEGREIGPFKHDSLDFDVSNSDVWAIMGFIGKGRAMRRRCVIYLWFANEDKCVFFSANSGKTLEDAIEIINAEDTNTGVYAEHQYIQIKLKNLGLAGEFVEQRLINQQGKHYDQLIYKIGEQKKFSLFFDISSFYGKVTPDVEQMTSVRKPFTEH